MPLPQRNEIAADKTWDLTRIFKNDAAFKQEFAAVQAAMQKLPDLKATATNSPADLAHSLDKIFALSQRVEKLESFASLASDVDTSNEKYLAMNSSCEQLTSTFRAQIAFLTPAILALSSDQQTAFLKSDKLRKYHHLLESIFQKSGHILSGREEKIIAQAETAMNADQTYSILTNSDLEYPYIQTNDEKLTQLNESSYDLLIQNENRDVRKEAFTALYNTYSHYERTFASLLSSQVKSHNFKAQVHHYQDAKTASLSQNFIPTAVYDNLLACVHEHLDLLHRYVALRKKVLHLDPLQMWDIYVPLVKMPQVSFSLEEAKAETRNALKILGSDYLKHVDYLYQNRVIDTEINQHKVSGAYSAGAYDTDAYELLNWDGSLDSVYTLIHETGHSVHSMYSRESQPYVYGDYPIFVAEIASTTNENILTEYFLQNITQPEARANLLNYYLDSFKGTVFRQAQFAEFEEFIHQQDQQGQALTADLLDAYYGQLNEKYYGPAMAAGSMISKEWARVPHFYYDFYVYQYATGFCAASALSKKLASGNKQELNAYLAFLKSGSSDYPINIMKKAGIDMTKKAYLEDAFALFAQRLTELENLL